MASELTLLAFPNISEGIDEPVIAAVERAFAAAGDRVRLLDRHSDPDHNRTAYTLAGPPVLLREAVLAGARAATELIDLTAHDGKHPYVGALDVAAIVHVDDATGGAAAAEALLLGDDLGRELNVPVLLYGALGGGRTRADLRRGGLANLASRLESGDVVPDFGPRTPHPTAGATLVAARPPLVAFNLELAPPATLEEATTIAATIREGAPTGLAGVRAIGLTLATQHGIAQVSCNVEDPLSTPLRVIVEHVQRYATVAAAEIVGLAPEAALEGFPADIPIKGFDPDRHVLERALASRGP
jgi:glutamate formiminotransferase/glutamate formiminotransferase/formiminotetrahydrofolate cyclodeaminase